MTVELLPPIPYEDWVDTRETLHRFAQLVGKVRLAHALRRNHWWNVPLHLTGCGITTRPMGLDPTFSVEFDFVAHPDQHHPPGAAERPSSRRVGRCRRRRGPRSAPGR